ncbi:MAG: hypothetical protein QOJ79_3385, partial [Actinomycetota bacterium]|nr:hypothetical protein [Actinomycetota bacterium]
MWQVRSGGRPPRAQVPLDGQRGLPVSSGGQRA